MTNKLTLEIGVGGGEVVGEGGAVLATELCWLFLSDGLDWGVQRVVAWNQVTMASWLFPNRVRPQQNLANSWVELGSYLEEGPGGKWTGLQEKLKGRIKMELA